MRRYHLFRFCDLVGHDPIIEQIQIHVTTLLQTKKLRKKKLRKKKLKKILFFIVREKKMQHTGCTTTALTVVIPNEYHAKLNVVRQQYDRAFERWMPHVNLLFPFVTTDHFDEIETVLTNALNGFGPITLQFRQIGSFTQGRNVTFNLQLDHKSEGFAKLQQLYSVIRKSIPNVQAKHDELTPHLTLGQCTKKEFTQEFQQQLLNDTQFDCTITEISFLSRGATTPMAINRSIKL